MSVVSAVQQVEVLNQVAEFNVGAAAKYAGRKNMQVEKYAGRKNMQVGKYAFRKNMQLD